MSKFLASTVLFCFLINPICSIVQLESTSVSFPDSPARFTKEVDGRICGNLQVANPVDACSVLLNKVEHSGGRSASIVLIVRGNCAFDEKIRNAQGAGFRAAIVYDDRPDHNRVSMMGNPDGLNIYAVFVSHKAGLTLREYAQRMGGECCIMSYIGGNGWTVLVISVMSVLAVISLIATILFTVNQLRDNRETASGLDSKTVDMLPTITFGSDNIIGCVGETCAICLEDFKPEEHLKALPCQHGFHVSCVNLWLTKWATFCPVCKHDLRTKMDSSIK